MEQPVRRIISHLPMPIVLMASATVVYRSVFDSVMCFCAATFSAILSRHPRLVLVISSVADGVRCSAYQSDAQLPARPGVRGLARPYPGEVHIRRVLRAGEPPHPPPHLNFFQCRLDSLFLARPPKANRGLLRVRRLLNLCNCEFRPTLNSP